MRLAHAIILFFIGLFLLLVAVESSKAGEVTCEVGCRQTYEGECNTNLCSPGRIFVGYHDTLASVTAAVAAASPCQTPVGGSSISASGNCPLITESSAWQIVIGSDKTINNRPQCTETSCTYNWSVYGYYYNGANPGTDYSVDSDGDGVNDNTDECPNTPTGVEVDAVGCPLDGDGDGIPDGIDPYPDDSDPFIYQLMGYQVDGNGDISFLCIKTHKGDSFCYGEFDSDGEIIISADNDYHDSSELSELTEDNEITETIPLMDDYVPKLDPLETLDFDEGADNTGNSIDTDYLADIVSNTKDALTNQENIGTYLKEMSDDIKTQNKILLDQNNNPIPIINNGEGGESPSATDIGAAVGDELEARDTAGEETTSDALTAIGDGNETFVGEFDETDKPEENLISTIYTDFKNNNPVSALLSGSSVDTSSANCSFTWDYNGTPVNFTICAFESQVDLVGTILLGLAGIGSLLIVFRR